MTETSPAAKPNGVMTNAQLGTLVSLASCGMLLGTMILSYLLSRARTPNWPPPGVEPVPPQLLAVATLVILASSVFVHFGWQRFRGGNFAGFRRFWGGACLLGVAFLVCQALTWMRYWQAGSPLGSSLAVSMFYAITGIHAFHVVVALAAIAWVFFASPRWVAVSPNDWFRRHESPQLTGWFWHFLGLAWMIIFPMIVL